MKKKDSAPKPLTFAEFQQKLAKRGYSVTIGTTMRLDKEPNRWFEFPLGRPIEAILTFVKDIDPLMDKYPSLQVQSSPPAPTPIPMILTCPACGQRHIDKGEFATKAHHTHSCQHCGLTWRPAIVATVGVQFLPGFKDA